MKTALTKKLNGNKNILSWQYNIKKDESHQIYLSRDRIESQRKTQTEEIEVIIYKQLKDGQIGEASFYFTPVEEFQIDEKIEKALYIASLAAQKSFKLADRVDYTEAALLDKELIREPVKVLNQFRERVMAAVNKEKGITLSSSECYVHKKFIEFANSRGCEGKTERSQINWDFVLLAGRSLESESWYQSSCCHHSQMNIEEKVREYGNYARDNIKTSLPRTIKTSIIVDAQTILPIFDPLIATSSGRFIYDKISSLKKGDNIFKGEKLLGEKLTLASNPQIPYGLKSSPFDSDGIALKRVDIIKDSRLENILATKRYASYLDITPTGKLSNLEINTGKSPIEKLLTPADKPVYHIIKFSFLLPDPVSGDFATEIRFGYEIRPSGERIPIKGGSVTGNVFEMFANASFSNKQVMEGSYIGPEAIRFEQVSISGT